MGDASAGSKIANLLTMGSTEGAEFSADDYKLLKRVLDALLSQRPQAETLVGAELLIERGYLFKDAEGRFRLSEHGKKLLRNRAGL